MASRGKLYDSEMETLLTVDLHALNNLTNKDLNDIDENLCSKKIITKNEFYQLRGSDRNVRKRIYDTWDIMSWKEESSVKVFGELIRNIRPDIFKNSSSQVPPSDRTIHTGINPSDQDANVKSKVKLDDTRYDMGKSPHGIAAIFNQEIFDEGSPRTGSSRDAEKLKAVFKMLNYKVEVHSNFTKSRILQEIRRYSSADMHNGYDSFICVFLSHGRRQLVTIKDRYDIGSFIKTKDSELHLEMVYEQFTGEKCPSLIGKPKIFIIQACRGNSLDKGVSNPNVSPSQTEFDVDNLSQDKIVNKFVPSHGDFLVAYATVPNYASIRHKLDGSWFIQDLADEFKSSYQQYHLQDMLTNVKLRVTQHVYKDQGIHKMQQPVIEDGLNKRVYFT